MGVVIGGGCEVEMWADEGRGWGHDGWAMHMVSYKVWRELDQMTR
jgi:hypothetical protein